MQMKGFEERIETDETADKGSMLYYFLPACRSLVASSWLSCAPSRSFPPRPGDRQRRLGCSFLASRETEGGAEAEAAAAAAADRVDAAVSSRCISLWWRLPNPTQ